MPEAKPEKDYHTAVAEVVDRVRRALGDRINELDEDNLISYGRCVALENDLYDDMVAAHARNGSYMTCGPNGVLYLDPSVKAYKDVSKERMAIGEKLGLSPKSRGENLREGRQVEVDETEAHLPKSRADV